jgi:glutaminyl-tRNA synthetase
VRLKHAYYVRCESVEKDADGNVVALHCTHDPATRGGWSEDGRKVKGTLHWVSAAHAREAEVRLYDHLFTKEDPTDVPEGSDVTANLNPDSLEVLEGCRAEPALAEEEAGYRCQFLRHGYFCVDPDTTAERLVFNRTVSLRDSWAKVKKKG